MSCARFLSDFVLLDRECSMRRANAKNFNCGILSNKNIMEHDKSNEIQQFNPKIYTQLATQHTTIQCGIICKSGLQNHQKNFSNIKYPIPYILNPKP